MVTKRFPIQLLFRIKHWLGQYVITMDIMRVGFPSLVQAYSRYTAIKLLLFLPLPLAIKQGGIGGFSFTYPLALSRVLTVAFSLNSGVWNYNWYTQDSKVNISNTAASNPKGFPYNWLVFGIV